MNITINGDVYITNYGKSLDELVGTDIEYDEDFDDECDDDCGDDCGDDCDGYCEDCEYGEDDEELDEFTEEDYDLFSDERFVIYEGTPFGELLVNFVRAIRDTDGCPFCVAEILEIYHDIIIDGLISV